MEIIISYYTISFVIFFVVLTAAVSGAAVSRAAQSLLNKLRISEDDNNLLNTRKFLQTRKIL